MNKDVKYNRNGSICFCFTLSQFKLFPTVINEWEKSRTLSIRWLYFYVTIWQNWSKEWN